MNGFMVGTARRVRFYGGRSKARTWMYGTTEQRTQEGDRDPREEATPTTAAAAAAAAVASGRCDGGMQQHVCAINEPLQEPIQACPWRRRAHLDASPLC